jgi:flagellar protein FlaF
MGFSVSGAAAIVFVGLFISLGAFYGATSNSFERVSEAQSDKTDRIVDTKNTAINVTLVREDGDRLIVHVNNTGATDLSINDTSYLVNNEYQTGWEPDARVAGDNSTDLWLPGDRLNITIRYTDPPQRVKIATETGVSETGVVP